MERCVRCRARLLQDGAKQYWAKDAGAKFNSVTVELDRLLEVVAAIAGEVKIEADSTLRIVTMVLIVVSLILGLLVLAVPMRGGLDKNSTPQLPHFLVEDHRHIFQ